MKQIDFYFKNITFVFYNITDEKLYGKYTRVEHLQNVDILVQVYIS